MYWEKFFCQEFTKFVCEYVIPSNIDIVNIQTTSNKLYGTLTLNQSHITWLQNNATQFLYYTQYFHVRTKWDTDIGSKLLRFFSAYAIFVKFYSIFFSKYLYQIFRRLGSRFLCYFEINNINVFMNLKEQNIKWKFIKFGWIEWKISWQNVFTITVYKFVNLLNKFFCLFFQVFVLSVV